MEIDYTRLMLGMPLEYKTNTENPNYNINFRIPTIEDLVTTDSVQFAIYSRVFTATIREIYSDESARVDQVERDYPTIWDAAWDTEMTDEVAMKLYKIPDLKLLPMIVGGFAYWIGYDHTKLDDFKPLSNKKIVNEKLDWVIDKDVFKEFCKVVRCVTLSKPNEDLIAPKNQTPNQQKRWDKLYAGRLRKYQRESKNDTLGDHILDFEVASQTFVPMDEIKKLTYYQFMNMLKGYGLRDASDKQFSIYTSYKYDTKDMKIKDWRDDLTLTKIE